MVYVYVFIPVTIFWILCGVLEYGLNLGFFQRHYYEVRSRDDAIFAAIMGLSGPIGLIIAYFGGERGYHGLVWKATDWSLQRKERSDGRCSKDRTPKPDKEERRLI